MITYDMTKANGPLYLYLYQCLKEDISSGKLRTLTKMPSKRNLARNLGVSTITIENAYGQLASEGYIYTEPKKGYFVADISGIKPVKTTAKPAVTIVKPLKTQYKYNLSSNKPEISSFPFTVWNKLMRETLSDRTAALLDNSDVTGVRQLREAIALHLSSFRGMIVDPDQIIVGAGTEYLYSLIINLLGRDKKYCIENPGYDKLKQIYDSNGVECVLAGLDENGIAVSDVRKTGADIVHTSPTHHFPTGITMPVSRRYELLAWANEEAGRYIIEDDYDSEFRLEGKPLSSFYSIDASERVIYLNTFSKSLTPTIRISYMVLPEHLINRYFEKLSFYACTVSTFEQYTLAAFISGGYFEKHINRMRLYYGKKRKKIIEILNEMLPEGSYSILENGSGLHFNIHLESELHDKSIKKKLKDRGIGIQAVSDYFHKDDVGDLHTFILNYSCIDMEKFPKIVELIRDALFS